MSTLTLMPIHLASDSLAQKYRKNNKPATRRAVQWRDVSDDEDRPRKTPLKVRGVLPNGQNRPQTNGRKRHRASQNGCAVSMPSTTIQEQKNSLPIAKGAPLPTLFFCAHTNALCRQSCYHRRNLQQRRNCTDWRDWFWKNYP